MPQPRTTDLRFRPSLPFVQTFILLSALWIAGGASRADVSGQILVRAVAWLILVVTVVFARPAILREARPIMVVLAATAILMVLQLVPVPPEVWLNMPGRRMFAEAAAASGQEQPWRPLSVAPWATLNAASSLIVPVVVLLCVNGLEDRERKWLPGLVLALVGASMLAGLLQFSGGGFNNPFINDGATDVSGTFANRNHFALFMAIGCLVAPVWVFLDRHRISWRAPLGLGLMFLFILTILASGSRMGLVLGAIGLGLGLLMARRGIARTLTRYPRWVTPAVVAGIALIAAILVGASIASQRALSVSRAIGITLDQDMRSRGLPTVLDIIGTYFPFGAGFGTFDTTFRIHEPFALLRPTYFNHAHNDFLEIVLDGGVPGAAVLGAALAWWAWASIQCWRPAAAQDDGLARLGSAILLLMIVASIFDYPLRTPMMMAIAVLAGVWLAGRSREPGGSTLPTIGQHL